MKTRIVAEVALWLGMSALAVFTATTAAKAADITVIEGKNASAVSLKISGAIKDGDAAILTRWVEYKKSAGTPVKFVYLDSPGGSVMEAAEMADTLTENNIQTVVGKSGRCISACVMAWAGGTTRWVTSTSRISVHSAYMRNAQDPKSDKVKETSESMAITLNMARVFYALGVPDTVIVKMIVTAPDTVTDLRFEDIRGFARMIPE